MPKTLESSDKERNRQKEEGGEGSFEERRPGGEGISEFPGVNLAALVREFGDWVTPFPKERDVAEERLTDQLQAGSELQQSFSAVNNIDRSRLNAVLQEIAERQEGGLPDLEDLDTRGVLIEMLRVLSLDIAPAIVSTAQLLEIISTTQTTMLSTMNNIAGSLEPFNTITISGIDVIEDADSAERVAPTGVNTRILFIRASNSNTDPIAFGDSNTDPDSGFILNPGEHIVLNMNISNRPLYMAADTEGQELELLGMI